MTPSAVYSFLLEFRSQCKLSKRNTTPLSLGNAMNFFATSWAFKQLFAQMHPAFFQLFAPGIWYDSLQGLLACQGSHRHSSVCTPPATQGTVPNDCQNQARHRQIMVMLNHLKSMRIAPCCRFTKLLGLSRKTCRMVPVYTSLPTNYTWFAS